MDLRSTQLKDTYGNLVTIGSVAGAPTTGTLQNGQGADLTSIDVTGTITSDGLTVNSGTSNNAASFISTDYQAHISFSDASTTTAPKIGAEGNDLIVIRSGTEYLYRAYNNGDFALFEDTGTTAKLYWDASTERLGIGTNSPSTILDVEGTSQMGHKYTGASDKFNWGQFNTDGDASINNKANADLLFATNNQERMRIDSDGNVGIGDTTIANPFVSAYSNILQVGTTSGNTRLAITSGGTSDLHFADSNTSAELGTYAGYISYKHATDNMVFGVDASEAMRIDSSGNVLVGMTTYSTSNDGHYLGANGSLFSQADGLYAGTFSRLTNDGEIVRFRKDATQVGSIGSISGKIFIDLNPGAGGAGLRGGSSSIIPYVNGADADDVLDLGASGVRFDDVYATNGTIQTSDRNEKQDIEELDDAELRVAQKAKTLLRKFRWKSSVAENENARIHFGIIAQDLEQAFTDEGLDAGRYGMFIKSTWTNEQGEEQTRLGVRYNQLLAFIISAL